MASKFGTSTRRISRISAAIAAAALLVAGCGGGTDSEGGSGTPGDGDSASLEHVNYLMAYLPDMIADHYLLAVHNGDFETCGIDFEYKSAADVSNALQLLITGGVDYAVVDPFTYISGLVKGLPIMAIGEEGARSGVSYASLAEENIQGPEDLVGKTVGVSPGLDNELYLKQIMADNLTAEQAATVKLVPSGNSLQPLLTGQIDMASEWFVNTNVQAAEARGIDLNYLNALDYGIAVPGNVIVTTTKRIEEDPDQVKRVLAATAAGQYESLDEANADLAVQLVTDAMGASEVAPAGVEKQIFTQVEKLKSAPEWSENGAMWNIDEGYTQAQDFLVQAGQLDSGDELPVDQLFSNDFLEQIYSESPPSDFNVADVCGGATSAGG
jgi:ABC-type nitrate/sulfonate/bicarbonate transport system substrate-binding protein